jgi:transitional endoplasmic reticulum ATPase
MPLLCKHLRRLASSGSSGEEFAPPPADAAPKLTVQQALDARPIKGVLFTGPPGTGKTMLGRIIANAADAVFYEISSPEIFSKWYGDSEKILRVIFENATKQSRSIIFFDEIDSIAGQRSGDAHEESKRAAIR